MTSSSSFHLRLFYSYSHKDHQHRARMERALTLLRTQDRVLKDWSDCQILAGHSISREIQRQMDSSDIFAFLLSPHFIASEACRQEWSRVGRMMDARPHIVCVPIILAPCDWKQLEGMSDLKALPDDGKPVTTFADRDIAWQQVCDGLRALVLGLRQNFTVRDDFRRDMDTTDFISQEHVPLRRVFVFPHLCSYIETKGDANVQQTIASTQELLAHNRVLVHGDELSGKSALCRYLFLALAEDARPVLYVNLAILNRRMVATAFRGAYERQYHGDYSLWRKKKGKTVILDNLSNARHELELLEIAVKEFDQVVVTTSSHAFYAYYRDDDRLAEFRVVEILPLTHAKQEQLIRHRLALSERSDMNITDGRIDQVENQVNAIIINNRIVPRYPFYVLSILQTYEAFMPANLAITSHGHCYHVLIVAHLLKAGIPRSDDEIDSCLNFAEHLAFEIYRHGERGGNGIGLDKFEEFVVRYRQTYLLKESTLSRLCDGEYGIVARSQGGFRTPYMYFFFLGRFLAKRPGEREDTIGRMLEHSYVRSNCLTLIFVVHHTSDSGVIEDIVLRNMCTLEDVAPSTLDREEARLFEGIVTAIPKEVTTTSSVEAERERERRQRDVDEKDAEEEDLALEREDEENVGVVNDVYRILKNNEILGQVLKNKYGSLERKTIREIIEAIADGGLRLVRLLVGSQEEMNRMASLVHKRRPDLDLERVKNGMRMLAFLWTMGNIEMVVAALNKPEIRDLVQEVVDEKGTAAYELIGYFLRLDTAEELTGEDHKRLKSMLSKYRYPFIERVLSLRTQWYLNTHKVRVPVEQAICAELDIKYRPRLKTGN